MQHHDASAPQPGHPFRGKAAKRWAVVPIQDGDSDLKLFVVSFTAFFICLYTFLI